VAEPTELGYKKYKSFADFKVAYDNRHFPHQVKWVAGAMIDEQYFFEQAEDAIWFFASGWRSRDFFANGEDGDMVGYGPKAISIDDQQRCEHCAGPLVPAKTEHVHCDTCGRPMEVCGDCFDNSDDCPECEEKREAEQWCMMCDTPMINMTPVEKRSHADSHRTART
jgi:hypothetical protein